MTNNGYIHQLNVSQGGVPKLPVARARIEIGGMAHDAQADRKHHGGPEQDLCLYSLEVIQALQAEGHPIEPGSAGDNITIGGLDWSSMERGVLLQLGNAVVAEVTWPATPCAKNARWFASRDYQRMSEELHPGWSRWYARVITPGEVAPGDSVTILENAE